VLERERGAHGGAALRGRRKAILARIEPDEQVAPLAHEAGDGTEGCPRGVRVVEHSLAVNEIEGAGPKRQREDRRDHEVDAGRRVLGVRPVQQREIEIDAHDVRAGHCSKRDRLGAEAAACVENRAHFMPGPCVRQPGQPDAPIQLHEILGGIGERKLALAGCTPFLGERLLHR